MIRLISQKAPDGKSCVHSLQAARKCPINCRIIRAMWLALDCAMRPGSPASLSVERKRWARHGFCWSALDSLLKEPVVLGLFFLHYHDVAQPFPSGLRASLLRGSGCPRQADLAPEAAASAAVEATQGNFLDQQTGASSGSGRSARRTGPAGSGRGYPRPPSTAPCRCQWISRTDHRALRRHVRGRTAAASPGCQPGAAVSARQQPRDPSSLAIHHEERNDEAGRRRLALNALLI